MASYSELYAVTSDPGLLERIAVAVAVAAQGINEESPATPYHDRRRRWARYALASPLNVANQIVWALVAQYADQTVAAITGATDAQILAAVESTVPVLVEL